MVQINTALLFTSLMVLPQISCSADIQKLIDTSALSGNIKENLKNYKPNRDTINRVSNKLVDHTHHKHLNIPAKIYHRKYDSQNLVGNSEEPISNDKKDHSANKIKSSFAESRSEDRTHVEFEAQNEQATQDQSSKPMKPLENAKLQNADLNAPVNANSLGDLSLNKIAGMFDDKMKSKIITHDDSYSTNDKDYARYIVESKSDEDDDDDDDDYSYNQYSDYAYKHQPVKYKIRELLTKNPEEVADMMATANKEKSNKKLVINDDDVAYDPYGEYDDEDDEFESANASLDYGFETIEKELDKIAESGKTEDLILPDYGPAFPSGSNKLEIMINGVKISLMILAVGVLV